MKNVDHILRSKSDPTVHTLVPTASMFDAVKLMAEKDVGALLIMEGETIVGMVSERDYARKIVLIGTILDGELRVRDIMTCPVIYVSSTAEHRGMYGADDRKAGSSSSRPG